MGTVMFFRLIGGAFGVALLSAVLIAGLNAAVLGVPGHEVLGPEPGLALMRTELAGSASPALLASLRDAVRGAFAEVFFYAAAIAGLTFIGSFGLKEIPLRGG